MSVDPNLLSKFLKQLTRTINSRQDMINWVKEFIEDIKQQEIAIKSTKTGAGVLGAVSAIALFTPFAPLALAGMATAGVASVATSIGDMIANKVKGGNLEEKVDAMKSEDAELEKLQNTLNVQAELLAKVRQFLMCGINNYKHSESNTMRPGTVLGRVRSKQTTQCRYKLCNAVLK